MNSCVQCGYSLRGLPARHECPECGLAYDELSEIWKSRHNKRLILSLALASFGWLWLTFNFSTGLRRSPVPRSLHLIIELGFLAIFVYLIFRFWRLYRGGQFAATMPDGLHFRSETTETMVLAWSNISRAAVKPSPLGAVIFLRREKEVRDIIGPFRRRMEAEDFVRHVEARLASVGGGTVRPGVRAVSQCRWDRTAEASRAPLTQESCFLDIGTPKSRQ